MAMGRTNKVEEKNNTGEYGREEGKCTEVYVINKGKSR
jgi:hypothetical protein